MAFPDPIDPTTAINIANSALAGNIATAVQASTLSTDIATKTTGSSAGILNPSGVATSINTTGVPIVDQPLTFFDSSTLTIPSQIGTFNITTVQNVSAYQGFSFRISWAGTGVANPRRFAILWYLDAAGTTQVDEDDFMLPDGNTNPFAQITGITRAPYMQIIVPGTGSALTAITGVKATLVLYKRPLRERFRCTAGVIGGATMLESGINGVALMSATVAAASTITASPITYAGPANFNIYTSASIGAFNRASLLSYSDGSTVIANAYLASGTGGGQSASVPLMLPRTPVIINVQNAEAATARSPHVALTMAG